MAARKFKKWSL